MKILVTGGIGHIGTNISIEAISQGHKVLVMDNLQRLGVMHNLNYLVNNFPKDKFEFIWGDIREAKSFDQLPKVDAIIHLAANPGIPISIKDPIFDFETNARGTLNTLEFSRKLGGVPFVYASTNKTFSDIINTLPTIEGKTRYTWGSITQKKLDPQIVEGLDTASQKIIAINENFPISGFGKFGHSPYGVSKLTGELYAQEYHYQYKIPIVINKMSCIFGLFQKGTRDQGWISHFVSTIGFGSRKIDIFGNGKQVRDLLDARDVAKLYLMQLEKINKCNGEIFTVGGGPENSLSLLEVIKKIETVTKKKTSLRFHKKRSADHDIYISSIKKVKKLLGFEPTIPFDQTLIDMVSEYKNLRS